MYLKLMIIFVLVSNNSTGHQKQFTLLCIHHGYCMHDILDSNKLSVPVMNAAAVKFFHYNMKYRLCKYVTDVPILFHCKLKTRGGGQFQFGGYAPLMTPFKSFIKASERVILYLCQIIHPPLLFTMGSFNSTVVVILTSTTP